MLAAGWLGCLFVCLVSHASRSRLKMSSVGWLGRQIKAGVERRGLICLVKHSFVCACGGQVLICTEKNKTAVLVRNLRSREVFFLRRINEIGIQIAHSCIYSALEAKIVWVVTLHPHPSLYRHVGPRQTETYSGVTVPCRRVFSVVSTDFHLGLAATGTRRLAVWQTITKNPREMMNANDNQMKKPPSKRSLLRFVTPIFLLYN